MIINLNLSNNIKKTLEAGGRAKKLGKTDRMKMKSRDFTF